MDHPAGPHDADPQPERLLQIGEVADEVGLSHRTVRYYDNEGLLTASARSAGNYRLYTRRDVERMRVIMAMKPLGFSLEEMGRLLTALDAVRGDQPVGAPAAPGAEGAQDTGTTLAHFAAESVRRRAKLAARLAMADDLITELQRHTPGA